MLPGEFHGQRSLPKTTEGKGQGSEQLLDYDCGGFPGGLDGKESACNAGDLVSIPELGRSPEEENGNPLQYSCLENSMDGGAWQATFHGVANSWT